MQRTLLSVYAPHAEFVDRNSSALEKKGLSAVKQVLLVWAYDWKSQNRIVGLSALESEWPQFAPVNGAHRGGVNGFIDLREPYTAGWKGSKSQEDFRAQITLGSHNGPIGLLELEGWNKKVVVPGVFTSGNHILFIQGSAKLPTKLLFVENGVQSMLLPPNQELGFGQTVSKEITSRILSPSKKLLGDKAARAIVQGTENYWALL